MTELRERVLGAFFEVVPGLESHTQLAALKSGGDLDLAALDLDSLTRFEIIMKIEDELDIEIDDDEVLDCTTLYQLVAVVTSKISA